MEPRLERLVELFSESLERDLRPEMEGELQSLLEDPGLVERFADWQASRSPTDGADPGSTPDLDRRVRGLFKGRNYLVRHWQQFLAAAVGIGLVGLFFKAIEKRQPDVVPVAVEDQALDVNPGPEMEAQPTRRPTLGLPPGYGNRPSHLESRVGRKVDLRWTLPEESKASITVYDAKDRLVRTVWQGRADAGRYTNSWNGKDDQGRLVEPGRYRLQAEAGGRVLSKKYVQLNASLD